MYIYIYMCMYIYICIYIYIERERERERKGECLTDRWLLRGTWEPTWEYVFTCACGAAKGIRIGLHSAHRPVRGPELQ